MRQRQLSSAPAARSVSTAHFVSHEARRLGTLRRGEAPICRSMTGFASGDRLPVRIPSSSVHDKFHSCAGRTPDAVAVIDQDRHVTYASLQRGVRRLAATLRTRGVRPGDPVALLATRSVEAVAAIIGILEAGGAYAPVDPHDPDERIRAIIEGSGAPVVVTQPDMGERVRSVAAEVVEIEPTLLDDGAAVPPKVSEPPARDRLAAIIYTSGTTGTPKGVEIPHSAVLERLHNGYPVRTGDLHKSPLNTVGHLSDLIAPLLAGGPVIVVPDELARDGAGLLELALRHASTRLVFVPSQLAILLEDGSEILRALRHLDTVIVSGEPLNETLAERFMALLPEVSLYNAYGATEVAGLASAGQVDTPNDITVGVPMPGFSVYLLNEERQPVRNGEVGEAYISSAQVAQGYRSNVTLTAERFLLDPFRKDGARMYRTGDLAQAVGDGRLRILGRRDREVKVHGFRVNLNEVEAVIESLPGIDRAVVVLDEAAGCQRLKAVVQPQRDSAAPDLSAVRLKLSQQLPTYMIPSSLHVIDRLPLLANGKVDRATLMASSSPSVWLHASTYTPAPRPLTDTERMLAGICRDILRLPEVDINEDFFNLGGDSLDAMRLLLRAEEAGLRLTLDQLAQAPSLSALAHLIDRQRHDAGPVSSLDSYNDPTSDTIFDAGAAGATPDFNRLARR